MIRRMPDSLSLYSASSVNSAFQLRNMGLRSAVGEGIQGFAAGRERISSRRMGMASTMAKSSAGASGA